MPQLAFVKLHGQSSKMFKISRSTHTNVSFRKPLKTVAAALDRLKVKIPELLSQSVNSLTYICAFHFLPWNDQKIENILIVITHDINLYEAYSG